MADRSPAVETCTPFAVPTAVTFKGRAVEAARVLIFSKTELAPVEATFSPKVKADLLAVVKDQFQT